MAVRIKPWECFPDRWFFTGILEVGNGNEYRVVVLKLPSYKWGFDFYRDANCWLQLAILYHGRDGFSILWLPCREQQ